jgi:hypothetical protein
MKPGSLRPELVIVGSGSLISAYIAAKVFDISLGGATPPLADALEADASSGVGLLAIGLLLGAAYVLGALVVQLTIHYPTRAMVETIRDERFNELVDLGAVVARGSAVTNPTAVSLRPAFTRRSGSPVQSPRRQVWPRLTGPAVASHELRHARSLALSHARVTAGTDLVREYEYRRSNRQVCMGLIPAVLLAAVAASVWPSITLRFGEHGARSGTALLLYAVAIAAVFVMVPLLYLGGRYQEKIAQSLLIDSAFFFVLESSTARAAVLDVSGADGVSVDAAPGREETITLA